MRVLDAALTTKQQLGTAAPYLRVYFDNRAGTTVAYTTRDATNYIWSIEQWEESWAGVTIVRLRNSPNTTFNSVDYRGYSVSVGWGYVLDSTPGTTWYSNTADMKVLLQRDISLEGELITEFKCVSKWYEIGSDYVWEGGKKIVGTIAGAFQIGELVTQATSGATGRLAGVSGTYIVVTRVTGTFATSYTCTGGTSGATVSAPTAVTDNYGDLVYASGETATSARIASVTGLTTTVDTDDPDGSMADTPKLAVAVGTSMRDVVGRMLLRSKCGARYCNDGQLHILYLNTATAAQYAFDGTHAFLEDMRDKAIILPNTVYFVDVMPADGIAATYVGTANDSTSVSAIGTFVAPIQVDPDIASNAEGNTRAAAWIAQKVAQAYQGKITAPMECGLEVYDMVQAVDARLGVTVKGRIGRIERQYIPAQGIYKVAMTLGSLYSEPSSMEPGTTGPDTGAQIGSLAKSPPVVAPTIYPWQLWKSVQPYVVNITFTSVDHDHVSWTAGTIVFKDGTSLSIDANASLDISAGEGWLYFTEAVATLTYTQTYADCVAPTHGLVALVAPNTVEAATANSKALIIPFSGKVPTLNADVVSCILLSAISANIGTITAGSITGVTVTASGKTAGSVGSFILKYDAATVGYLYSATDGVVLLGNTALYIGTAADGGVNIGAGTMDATPVANSLQLRALDRINIGSGTADPAGAATSITIYAQNDVNLYADDDVNIAPTGDTLITRLKTTNNDVEASRVLGTVYQNTGAYPLLVVVTVQLGEDDEASVYVEQDDATPDVYRCGVTNSNAALIVVPITFVVPVGAYYKVTVLGGTALSAWDETTIGG